MKSRLSCSVPSLHEPDILILDEMLSVGDGTFRRKNEEKMMVMIRNGTAILVSHSLDLVRALCRKILWLHQRRQITFTDDVRGDVINIRHFSKEEFLNRYSLYRMGLSIYHIRQMKLLMFLFTFLSILCIDF